MKSNKLVELRSNRESGSVLAELTLIIPMLTVLILAVTDFGMFLQSYFQICHIAREGLRTAVATPDLSGAAVNSGNYVVTTDTPGIISYLPAAATVDEQAKQVQHKFIHNRLQMLLKADNGTSATHSLQLVNNAVQIQTSCVGDIVTVQVSAQYRPITPFNDVLSLVGFTPLSFNFSSRSQGTYLFNNCAA
jgi:hypothetical protein